MALNQIFAQLLVNSDKVVSQVRHLSHEEWGQLVQVARRTNLVTLLHDQMKQIDVQPPEYLQNGLRDHLRQATMAALQKRAELARVLTDLNDSGIIPILFKGAVLAHTVYPIYTHRPMGDIDLWISRQNMAQAQAVLKSIGYVYKEKEHRSHAMQALGDGELQMRGQTPLLGLVELHYGVFAGEWLRIVTRIDRTAVYDRLVSTTICDQPVRRLVAEDAFIQIALHVGINHQMTVNGFRSLVDLEFLAQSGVDWQVVVRRCREWRVYTAVSFVIDLWNQLFATAQSAQAATVLPFQRDSLLRMFVTPTAIVEGHNLSGSRRRLLYQLALVDRGRDALKLIAHTVWPDRAWLDARYSSADLQTRFQHFRQIASGKL